MKYRCEDGCKYAVIAPVVHRPTHCPICNGRMENVEDEQFDKCDECGGQLTGKTPTCVSCGKNWSCW